MCCGTSLLDCSPYVIFRQFEGVNGVRSQDIQETTRLQKLAVVHEEDTDGRDVNGNGSRCFILWL
ncbi:unnamed protein product [Arabidopsis lyrata]|uniref:Predicted protein n=1 Tax=Arabidopsis lyrata subsp. lyrata TaxID=81972 RepID=D7LYA1_ARALL|nr:predicted protein [Arabidopsis lyrata subsp. lyrata]CAH8270099.1 unnamed protein product [Arabidopsis lyrata]